MVWRWSSGAARSCRPWRRPAVELRGCSYLAIENLTIDGRDRGGAFGVSASYVPSHHIRIENCTIMGHGADQSVVGISTKIAAWDWVIRRNTIIAAGTGAYLGDSDGTEPFIGGLIEYNLFFDAHGYNMQIKHQNPRDPKTPGIPTTPQKTILRHNVFLKGTMLSDSGDRPNLLVGAVPAKGLGSEDSYEVYGNLFYHNHDESLLQAEGRVSIHDNIFVDCTGDAIHIQNHYGKVRRAYIYNNTFYGVDTAVRFVHPALEDHLVVGNLMFSRPDTRPQPTAWGGYVLDATFGNGSSKRGRSHSHTGQSGGFPAFGRACAANTGPDSH